MPAQNLPGLVLDRAHPLSRGLVGWWPLNEGAGTRVNELVGANAGGLQGGYQWADGINLNGTTGYVRVPHKAQFAILGDLTCVVMARPTSSGVYSGLITKTNSNMAASWDWYIHANNSIYFWLGNGTAGTSTIGTSLPTFNKWNQFAATVRGTTVTHYLNGAPNGTATNAQARADVGSDVIIGSRNDLFPNFPGFMRHARIYNRALSAIEVAQLYADPLAGALAPVRTRRIYIAGGAPAPQAPTYFGSASNPADNGAANEPSTLAVTPPGSMVSGDLVVLIGTIQVVGTGNITVSATGGQTWSSVSESGANDAAWGVFWCEYNGTWSADPSLAFAAQGGTQATTAVMHVFRKGTGTSGSWAVDTAYAGASEASASPMVITGITPGANNNVVLAGWLITNASTWGTLSGAGWVAMATAQYRNTAGSDLSATFAHQLQLTAAATNNVSQVPSTATTGASFTMAWKLVAPGSAKFRRTRSEHGARMGSRQATR